ncbi:TetR/AcrR family transcriptional regulator C-terminal domain-containing protein [Streptococcus sp. Marseille-P8640]|uniref:TetR/AcrR family transcriptional regulator C-terminal domain-containing protein n=1 Tax=Streptococcus sp. Marseille-P8640 TaxID=2866596 RepID=UPI0023B976C8|nr:TetR/AcrR family transcriptional regulator C-terminal domain-containing protein [Streptococcus sp. Marseille-P8640]
MTTVMKKVLASTLKELMDKKSLSKITINDLTQSCGVSRQTFYNHFHDIYELVEWIYLNEAHITLGENISYENWQDALEALFQYMDDNRNFVLNTYRSVFKENVERLLQREVERFLTDLIFNEINVSGEEAEQVQFSIEFYTYALVGVVLDWISRQMPGTAKELVEKIEQVMIGTIVARISQ